MRTSQKKAKTLIKAGDLRTGRNGHRRVAGATARRAMPTPRRSWWEGRSREQLRAFATDAASTMSASKTGSLVRPPSYDSILHTHPAISRRRTMKQPSRPVRLETDDAQPNEL